MSYAGYDLLKGEQQHLFDEIIKFIDDPHPARNYFLYEGLAGTGKSFELSVVAKNFRNSQICSPFAKAASNLSRKTGMPATTVHSAIYNFLGEDAEHKELIFEEKIKRGRWDGKIALLDEHSTCGLKLGRDLMATGCKVIACGDPGQLPPVNDTAFFSAPDFTLTEIHRQAWDSPIIRQAHNVRANGFYQPDGAGFQVKEYCSGEDVLNANMILCWTNKTRHQLNALKRSFLGIGAKPPLKGEPVMAFKVNDHKIGTLNGGVYTLLQDHEPGCGFIHIINERGEEKRIPNAWIDQFEPERKDDEYSGDRAHPFAMAYCSTVHKAIGSEYDNILLVDEYPHDKEDWIRWAYTGITRAAKNIIVKV